MFNPALSSSLLNAPPTTEMYTLSLHDALPIWKGCPRPVPVWASPASPARVPPCWWPRSRGEDRKSTRLNSSHQIISYAVFCLKKKNLLERIEQGSALERRLPRQQLIQDRAQRP